MLVLKKEIGKLITRLTRFSGAGVEAEFQQEVEAASDLAEAISPNVPQALPTSQASARTTIDVPQPTLADLLSAADESPILAITQVWHVVEDVVHDIVGPVLKHMTLTLTIRQMEVDETIDQEVAELFRLL